jgi:hypothetical protein
VSDIVESKTGYTCPNCETVCSEQSIISKTDPVFVEEPDPHYSWDETHKCVSCETVYILHNGT